MPLRISWDIPALDRLNQWMRSHGIPADDCRRLARLYMESMNLLLQENNGLPPGAMLSSNAKVPTYILEYIQGEIWAVYTRIVIGGWWKKLRGQQRIEIVIRDLIVRTSG